jgi:hypothetical protein
MEWRSDVVECDWMARPADPWDRDLNRQVSGANASQQALRDAIAVRKLLFSALPEVESASLRAFRQSPEGTPELIITGTVTREEDIARNVPSLAMQAKLLGFQFWMEDGFLETLQSEDCALSF